MEQSSINSEKLKQMHQFLDNELQGLRNLTTSNNITKDSQPNSNQSSKYPDQSNLSLSQLDNKGSHIQSTTYIDMLAKRSRQPTNIILEQSSEEPYEDIDNNMQVTNTFYDQSIQNNNNYENTNQYPYQRTNVHKQETTQPYKQIRKTNSQINLSSDQEHKQHTKRRSRSNSRQINKDLERELQEIENELNKSLSTKHSQTKQNRKTSIKSKQSSIDKSTDNSFTKNNKQIQQQDRNTQKMKAKLEKLSAQLKESNSNLVKERQNAYDLRQELENKNRKIRKLENYVKKSKMIEQENQELLDSFDKSEYIRQQQKNLINQLKQELQHAHNHPTVKPQKTNNPTEKKRKKIVNINQIRQY